MGVREGERGEREGERERERKRLRERERKAHTLYMISVPCRNVLIVPMVNCTFGVHVITPPFKTNPNSPLCFDNIQTDTRSSHKCKPLKCPWPQHVVI